MNPFDNITYNKAFRVIVNGAGLTRRLNYEDAVAQGKTPEQIVAETIEKAHAGNCTVEYFTKNGSSFKKAGQFEYSISMKENTPEPMKKGIPLSGAYDGMIYTGHEGLLAKQYEKWYNDEAEKSRNLARELDDTIRERNSLKNELELLNQKNELETIRKDIERDKQAQQGLSGFMDTLEKNSFLQGLLERVVDNMTRGKEVSGLPKVNDPEIQQAITEAMNVLVRLASSDREHFGYTSLILDKVFSDKQMAQYIYKWMNTPQPDLANTQ